MTRWLMKLHEPKHFRRKTNGKEWRRPEHFQMASCSCGCELQPNSACVCVCVGYTSNQCTTYSQPSSLLFFLFLARGEALTTCLQRPKAPPTLQSVLKHTTKSRSWLTPCGVHGSDSSHVLRRDPIHRRRSNTRDNIQNASTMTRFFTVYQKLQQPNHMYLLAAQT